MTAAQVRIGGPGGVWLSTVVPVGGIQLDTRWPLGGYQLDLSLLVTPQAHPSAIVGDARCDLIDAGRQIFTGSLAEPDWSAGTLTASGLCREAETTLALTASNTTSSTPDEAIDAAISRGAWRVTRPASLSSTPLTVGNTTASLNYVSELLDQWALSAGRRWYVDSSGAVRSGVDPTTPEIYILPGVAELSWSTETQASRLAGSWTDTSGMPQVTLVGSGSVEQDVDLTNAGPLTATQASAILASILADATSGGWSGSLPALSPGQWMLPGGGYCSPARLMQMVERGLMVRLLGHRDPRPGRASMVTDVVIGQAVWNVDDDTVTLTPLGSAARDFASIVEQYGGEAA